MPLTSRRRWLVLVLALALWFASALGLTHRTLHSPGAAPGVLASLSVASSAISRATDANARLGDGGIASADLAAMFGHHSDAECRLYDQLSYGASAPCVPLVVLPMLLPAATFAYLEGEALARWVLLLRARGPPFTR